MNPAWADRYDLDLLPISIPDWPKEPAVVRDKETGEVIDSKEPLIDKIAVLLPQADCVIHAGDPDDEGQLIVDEVLDYLGYEGEVLRVYVNDNIAKNIVRAFDNLVPNEGCRAAGAAANARSMADKCFGVNESRLASTRLHGGFYVGRVQTPTLGLVVARDEAIENHVTRKFYELTATGGCPDADSQTPPCSTPLRPTRMPLSRGNTAVCYCRHRMRGESSRCRPPTASAGGRLRSARASRARPISANGTRTASSRATCASLMRRSHRPS